MIKPMEYSEAGMFGLQSDASGRAELENLTQKFGQANVDKERIETGVVPLRRVGALCLSSIFYSRFSISFQSHLISSF